MVATSNFICNIGEAPFRFLVLQIGAIPSRMETWHHTIDSVNKKLTSWKCKHLCFAGRVILMNFLLSSLPLKKICDYLWLMILRLWALFSTKVKNILWLIKVKAQGHIFFILLEVLTKGFIRIIRWYWHRV